MNNKINIINARPKKYYFNPFINKGLIFNENINMSGIYCWYNVITDKLYIGSAINLNKRLRDYFSYKYLEKERLRSNSLIVKALLKYDYSNFILYILEYCNTNELIKREQHFIDTLRPEYNICIVANSRLGIRHKPETLLKFKSRKFSPEALANLRKAKAGVIPSSKTKTAQLLATGYITIIINKTDFSIKKFDSTSAAARYLDVNPRTLLYHIKKNKPFKDNYLIIRFSKWKL